MKTFFSLALKLAFALAFSIVFMWFFFSFAWSFDEMSMFEKVAGVVYFIVVVPFYYNMSALIDCLFRDGQMGALGRTLGNGNDAEQ